MFSATITGNICAPAELKATNNGTTVCEFRVAVNRGKGNDQETCFVRCSLFGNRANSVQPYLNKGTKVTCSGNMWAKLNQGNDGKQYLNVDMSVNDLDFSNPMSQQPRAGYGQPPQTYVPQQPATYSPQPNQYYPQPQGYSFPQGQYQPPQPQTAQPAPVQAYAQPRPATVQAMPSQPQAYAAPQPQPLQPQTPSQAVLGAVYDEDIPF